MWIWMFLSWCLHPTILQTVSKNSKVKDLDMSNVIQYWTLMWFTELKLWIVRTLAQQVLILWQKAEGHRTNSFIEVSGAQNPTGLLLKVLIFLILCIYSSIIFLITWDFSDQSGRLTIAPSRSATWSIEDRCSLLFQLWNCHSMSGMRRFNNECSSPSGFILFQHCSPSTRLVAHWVMEWFHFVILAVTVSWITADVHHCR